LTDAGCSLIAPAGTLTWIDLPECQGVVDHGDQQELERTLRSGQLEQIYTMGRRSVYKGRLSDGRKVAIKEVCYRGKMRQFKMRHVREPKVLHEFRSGCSYLSKGGKTPRFLGMAVEQNALLLKRGFIFLDWLDNAITLTEYLKQQKCSVPEEFWHELATAIVASAQTGLVHGGHSPENVMIVADEDDPALRFQVIDFADSEIFERFSDSGFASDISRIGARLVTENACNREQIIGFLRAVVEKAWQDSELHSKWFEKIQSDVDAFLSHKKKM
jgi:hypothetical protein